MADILHRISINASPESVRELIATKEGIEQWWTGVPVGGDASVGGNLLMYFGGPDPAAVMELVEDLIGIKRGLEGGAFTPFPAGQVSRWG
jgi:hypothetical protein